MKFEFVEFYPFTDKTRGRYNKKICGTLHIYAIDCELDIRGIAVSTNGRSMFFNFPQFSAIDDETGEKVRYPLMRWTNQETHKQMMEFLHKEVRPKILEMLKNARPD